MAAHPLGPWVATAVHDFYIKYPLPADRTYVHAVAELKKSSLLDADPPLNPYAAAAVTSSPADAVLIARLRKEVEALRAAKKEPATGVARDQPNRYCWSHGFCYHPGTKCKNKKEGHQDTATITSIMGGSSYKVDLSSFP